PVPPAPPAPPSAFADKPAAFSSFERDMKAWEKKMEKWGEEYGDHYDRHAKALAAASTPVVPQVIQRCGGNPTTVSRSEVTSDGRQRIIVCDPVVKRHALDGLRNARATIAGNGQMDPDVRN